MKTYRELSISGVNDKALFVQKIKNYVSPDWICKTDTIDMYNYLFFDYRGTNMPKARVSIMLRENDSTLKVGNIIPLEKSELSIDEYNQLLTLFYNDIMKPFAENNQRIIVHPPTGDVFDPLQVISEKALKKLKDFHDLSNRATGSAHPEDKKLWFDFILQTVEDRQMFDANTLYHFLQDEDYWNGQAWDESIASDLADEYEQGCDLLEYNHGKRNY